MDKLFYYSDFEIKNFISFYFYKGLSEFKFGTMFSLSSDMLIDDSVFWYNSFNFSAFNITTISFKNYNSSLDLYFFNMFLSNFLSKYIYLNIFDKVITVYRFIDYYLSISSFFNINLLVFFKCIYVYLFKKLLFFNFNFFIFFNFNFFFGFSYLKHILDLYFYNAVFDFFIQDFLEKTYFYKVFIYYKSVLFSFNLYGFFYYITIIFFEKFLFFKSYDISYLYDFDFSFFFPGFREYSLNNLSIDLYEMPRDNLGKLNYHFRYHILNDFFYSDSFNYFGQDSIDFWYKLQPFFSRCGIPIINFDFVPKSSGYTFNMEAGIHGINKDIFFLDEGRGSFIKYFIKKFFITRLDDEEEIIYGFKYMSKDVISFFFYHEIFDFKGFFIKTLLPSIYLFIYINFFLSNYYFFLFRLLMLLHFILFNINKLLIIIILFLNKYNSGIN